MKSSLHIFEMKEGFLLVILCLALGMFVGMLFQGLAAEMQDANRFENVALLVSELVMLIPAYFILKQRNISWQNVLPLNPVAPLSFFMVIILVAGLLGLITVFEVLVIPAFPVPDFLRQLETNLAGGSLLDTIILLLAATLVAPIVEEALFRGVLQHSILHHYGSFLPAIVIPTLMFSLVHIAYLFYFPALVELLILAFTLAWLMMKTGNLLVVVLAHGLFNLSSFSSLFSLDFEMIRTLDDLGWNWIIVSGLLFLTAVSYFKKLSIAHFDDLHLIPPVSLPGETDD